MTKNQTLFLSDNYIMLVEHNIWYLIFNLPLSPEAIRMAHPFIMALSFPLRNIHTSLKSYALLFESIIAEQWPYQMCLHLFLKVYFGRRRKNRCQKDISTNKIHIQMPNENKHLVICAFKHTNLNCNWWNSGNFIQSYCIRASIGICKSILTQNKME